MDDGLSSDDDEVQFTGTLDADAARERDRAAAEASGAAAPAWLSATRW